MKVDYLAHDRVYKRLRTSGASGWSNSDEVARGIAVISRLLATTELEGRIRALEIGCGAGNLTEYLASLGFETHGIDIAPEAIRWAKARTAEQHNAPQFVTGDVCSLDTYPNRSFELVVDGRCLHCIIGEDRTRVLESVARVLEPGGYFIVMTMVGPPVPAMLGDDKRYDPATGTVLIGDLAIRYLGSVEQVIQEIERAGFELVCSDMDHTDQPTLHALARRR